MGDQQRAWPAAMLRPTVLARLMAAVIFSGTVSCASQAPLHVTSLAPDDAVSVSAAPCGDNQPGRYEAELFTAGSPTTTEFSSGLRADIYQPQDDPASCRVGVVWVHGGGFTEGTRNGAAEREWGATLASRGYVVASIDYRLGGGEQFGLEQATTSDRIAVVANAITDAQTAVRWMRETASNLLVDPARVAIGGTSAGAMTAAGAALAAVAGAEVCTVVAVAGAVDPSWVHPNPVSILFVHGDADNLVSYRSAQTAASLLTSQGGRAEVHTITGAGHEITGVPTAEVELAAATWFLEHAAVSCG
jgi:acetyl esterase/lipase